MKKFVSSVIYCLFMALLSIAVMFLLQAPLISFVYYVFFSEGNSIMFNQNVINKVVNKDTITLILMIMQIILSLGFIFALFEFISKVIHIFLKDEKLVRPYYIIFFFMTTVIPVILIFLSIFLKVKLLIMTLVVEGVFTVLNIVIIVFSRKILPDTTDYEYRKYLFTEGSSDD